jgi:hypothetical protein
VEPRSASADGVAGDPVAPPRQRWRLVLARSPDAPRIGGRELSDAWDAAIDATGLPLHRPAGRIRARVAFGAPLQVGIAAERELADLFLVERVPAWRMREALAGVLPDGWSLVDLFDVWVGGPPLAGRVAAADYRIELGDEPDRGILAAAARALLEAGSLPRTRQKGSAAVPYDLRALLVDLAIVPAGAGTSLRVRTRIHPELGSGRPDEVVAALGDWLRYPLETRAIVRERVLLADEIA